MAAMTVAVGATAGWAARDSFLGAVTLGFAALTLCLGPNTVAYPLECERVMAVAQVVALVSLTVGVAARRRARPVARPLTARPRLSARVSGL